MQVSEILWPTNLDFSPHESPGMRLTEPLGINPTTNSFVGFPTVDVMENTIPNLGQPFYIAQIRFTTINQLILHV